MRVVLLSPTLLPDGVPPALVVATVFTLVTDACPVEYMPYPAKSSS